MIGPLVRPATLLAATTVLLATPVARADPAPPPPPALPNGSGFPPLQLLLPGKLLQPYGAQEAFSLYSALAGPPEAFDARGVGVATNADPNQAREGLPGSKLGSTPTRSGHFGPTPGIRTDDRSGGVGISSTADADPTNPRHSAPVAPLDGPEVPGPFDAPPG